MATWADFLATLGTQVNVLGTQCVAVANYYHRDVLGKQLPSGIQSAHQWYTQFESKPQLVQNYDKIPASMTTARAGDVCVEYPTRGNDHGHICVVVTDWNGTFYETYDQNINGVQRVFKLRKTGAGCMGYLRPKNNPASSEVPLTEEQARLLKEINDAVRSGANSLQSQLNSIKQSTESILATVSEKVRRNGQDISQKDDRAATQDFFNQVLDLINEIDAGFESVGYDNIAEPAQINYYQSEADPGESSVQTAVRNSLDDTKLIT